MRSLPEQGLEGIVYQALLGMLPAVTASILTVVKDRREHAGFSLSLASFYGSTAWSYVRALATASISWAICVALAWPRPLPMRS